jgi:dihydrofolate reductase
MANALNSAVKHIVTHRPDSLEWGPFEAVDSDLVEGVRRIKSQPGRDLVLWGSSTLTSTLMEHGLADEVLLIVYPVFVGMGKRFFATGTPARRLELTSSKALPTGAILNLYKVMEPLKAG